MDLQSTHSMKIRRLARLIPDADTYRRVTITLFATPTQDPNQTGPTIGQIGVWKAVSCELYKLLSSEERSKMDITQAIHVVFTRFSRIHNIYRLLSRQFS